MTSTALKSRKIALPKRPLSVALSRAAGLLRGKLKKTPLQYQRTMRKEW